MNNFYYALKGGWKCAAAPLLFFLFFLMSTENASAQNYVDGPTAVQKLKAESNLIYGQLLLETPGSVTYNTIASRIHYYGVIGTLIDAGKSVAVAIEEAIPGLCYPSLNADCTQLDKPKAMPIVEDTRVLLSN